jgi:hypothetical protein
MTNKLLIHVIEPKYRIDWSSPRSLALTSLLNSLRPDYAPIGHFAVEIICSTPNKYGINHIITGMEREHKAQSRKITLQKKLGLGVLQYSFKGALQGSESSLRELESAKKDKRLKTITIPTSAARSAAMFDFIDQWIESGSYQVYGGAKNVTAGEGAGCADFAMELFRIATGSTPPAAWSVSLPFPKSLMGDGEKLRVSFLRLLSRSTWAEEKEAAMNFEIADTNLVSDWLRNIIGNDILDYHFDDHLVRDIPHPEPHNFTFKYPKDSSKTPQDLWNYIKI